VRVLTIFSYLQNYTSSLFQLKNYLSLVTLVLMSLLYISPLQANEISNGLRDLYLGQSEILSIKNVKRVSIGNGALLDVKVLDNTGQILLLAKQPGITDLRVWKTDGEQSRYQFRILRQSPEQVLDQVRTHLSGIEGVKARLAGNQIVIEGQALRNEDINLINVIAKQLPNVSNYVSAGSIPIRSMIHFDVKILEIKHSGVEKLGIEWDTSTSGPTFGYLGDFVTNGLFRSTQAPSDGGIGSTLTDLALAAGTGNVYLGMSTLLRTNINLLKDKGYARILAEPKLSCRSGGKANFQVGGEIPYPTTGNQGSSNVEFKSYGIMLDVEPVADSEGYIMTKLDIEMSNPDFSRPVQVLPIITTRSTSTEINLRSGQTLVVSGLIDTRGSKGVTKMPGLGDIPLLGELFKSRSFENDETELIMFLTPTIIDPEHPINLQALRRVSEMKEIGSESLRFNLMD
jgi:pilus assembly protein CpaC